MSPENQKIKILAQAVYEIRLLLANNLGGLKPGSSAEAVAAHLAYALHNEALAVIEDRTDDFDVEAALKKIKRVDELTNESFLSRFRSIE